MQAIQSRPLDLNILPAQYRPRHIKLSMVAAVVVVIAALLGLVPMYNALTAAHAQTVELESRLTQAKGKLVQTQAERAQAEEQLAALAQQISQSQAEIVRLQTEYSTLNRQRLPRSANIAAAIAALVPRIRVKTIVQEGDTLTLTGQAGSQGLVLDYARALQASDRFNKAQILSMVDADPLGLIPDVEFSIQVE